MDWNKQEMVRLLTGQPGTAYQQSTDAEKAITRNWIKNLLRLGSITVTFTKADGTDREMLCTLSNNLIPQKTISGPVDGIVKESNTRKAPDEHSLRVFDIGKQEWRSFRFDRLKNISAQLDFK